MITAISHTKLVIIVISSNILSKFYTSFHAEGWQVYKTVLYCIKGWGFRPIALMKTIPVSLLWTLLFWRWRLCWVLFWTLCSTCRLFLSSHFQAVQLFFRVLQLCVQVLHGCPCSLSTLLSFSALSCCSCCNYIIALYC